MKVIYTGCDDDQVRWGGNSDPIFLLGNTYEIEKIEDSWHKVKLGIEGKFKFVLIGSKLMTLEEIQKISKRNDDYCINNDFCEQCPLGKKMSTMVQYELTSETVEERAIKAKFF